MYYIYKSKLMSLVVLISTVVLSTSSYAVGIPQQISYQGKLLDAGIAVNGIKSMTFSLDSSWTETHPSVTIANGLYSVQLGSINPIPLSTFANSTTVNLEISVDGTNLTPTLDVLSVAYAFVAENAKDADKLNGNNASHYLDWNNLTNIPSGFADGVDNESSGSTSETDPVFVASVAKNITNTNITNWNNATGWGNHANAGYKTSESDPIWSSVATNYYTKSQISVVGTSNNYNDLSNKPTIPSTSNFVSLTGAQTISGNKTFTYDLVTDDLQVGSSTNFARLKVFGELQVYNDNTGTQIFEVDSNANQDAVLNNPHSGGKVRIADDLYLQYSDTSSWRDLEVGDIDVNDGNDISLYNSNNIKTGYIGGHGNELLIKSYDTAVIKLAGGDIYISDNAYKPGGGSWATSSDRRLKDIGKTYLNSLEAINAIKPVYYNYKQDNPLELPSEETYVGVIAQEIQKVIPEAVNKDEQGYLTVNNDPIIWAMLNAIKELSTEVSALKIELKAMKEAVK